MDTIFPRFSDITREKPRDMIFIADESPDFKSTLAASAQHVLIMLMFTVYVVILGQEIGITGTKLRSFVSVAIVICGITTLLQSLKTRFSSGHLVIHAPNILSIAALALIVPTHGFGAAAGAYLISGILIIGLARFLPYLQKIFPPEVTGILLVLLGLSLVKGGAISFTGYHQGVMDSRSMLIAVATLGTIVFISIWTSEKVRIYAVAAGTVMGLIVAALTGMFSAEQVSQVASQPFFTLPFLGYSLPQPKFVISAVIPLLVIEIISAIGSLGKGVAIDKLNHGKWRRADLPMIGRLVTCHGISTLLSGIAGAPSTVINTPNIGLAHSTGISARKVGIATGIILIVASCLPQLSSFITTIPKPVMGAIIIYTAGFLTVTGMQMILSRMMNNRRTFMVGLSITVGAAIILMPELTANAPGYLKTILGSGLTTGVLTAIILNLIFRIGIAQTGEIALNGAIDGGKATRFLEDCGISWGARQDVIIRSGEALIEVLETLQQANRMEGQATLQATFDEYKILLTLKYPGRGITFSNDSGFDLKKIMDGSQGEDAIDDAMSNISTRLIQKLADKVSCDEKDNQATLFMHFNH